MWRNGLKEKDSAYWEESKKKECDLVKMLERRDNGMI